MIKIISNADVQRKLQLTEIPIALSQYSSVNSVKGKQVAAKNSFAEISEDIIWHE